VDGFLARRWHVESPFGKLADPLADRLMIGTAVLLEWHAGRLPWAALAIPLRDVILLAVTPAMIARGYRFEVNLLGKAATWLLFLGVGCSMVTHPSTAWPLWIFWSGFALAIVSLVFYGRKAREEVLR
jgi:CDP-diacylglycerol---glycerol-3-phosphate 3-phosphatidyltransferase